MLSNMLDIRLIRQQPDFVRQRLATRGPDSDQQFDALLQIDVERRRSQTRLQELQAERNRLSKEIGRRKGAGEDASELQEQVKAHSVEMQELNTASEELSTRQEEILLRFPNMPLDGVPEGADEAANPVIRTHGEPPAIESPLGHVEIAERLGLIDSERATKISGSGFACFTGQGARLERALINFLLDLQTKEGGYREVSPPFLIRRECMVGTGQLPKFEEDMYGMDGGTQFLAPTAEVPLTNLYRSEVVDAESLPIKLTAYTPCFRREAGAAGRETRGLIRMHQFDKIELVKICRPENSAAELESLTADAERVLQSLDLHYRVIELCTGDLGFSAARTYDLEVWAPGQGTYLEVSSCSNFQDFQARRMNLRFKERGGKPDFCHTLNGSGTALPRLYVAVLEAGQQPDGSVKLPSALVPYFGSDTISPQ